MYFIRTSIVSLFAASCFLCTSSVSAENFGIHIPDKVLCEYRSNRSGKNFIRAFKEQCPRRWRQLTTFRSAKDVDSLLKFNTILTKKSGTNLAPVGCFKKKVSATYSSKDSSFDTKPTIQLDATCELDTSDNLPKSSGTVANHIMIDSGFTLKTTLKTNTYEECLGPIVEEGEDGLFTSRPRPCATPVPLIPFSNGSNQTLSQNSILARKTISGSEVAIGKSMIAEVDIEGLREYSEVQYGQEALAVAELELYCCPAGSDQ